MLVSSLYITGGAVMQVDKTISMNSDQIGYSTTTDDIQISSKDVEKYIRSAYKNEPILIDVARCESTFRQFGPDGHLIRGKVNNADVGVMQINEAYHSDKAVEMGLNIYTMEGNVAYARYLYEKYGTKPWNSSSACWSPAQVIAKK